MKKKISNLQGVFILSKKQQQKVFAGATYCRTNLDCILRDENGEVTDAGFCNRHSSIYVGRCEF